jgi:8-oxo-dGTP pyrophosphatase MutT (NUDIX family)
VAEHRSETEPPLAPGEIAGAVVLLVDRAGRVLLQQRDDATPPAGYGRWAMPGGHIEVGESPREAAVREFEEETGLRVTRLRRYGTFDQPSPRQPGVTHRLHVFLADDEVDESAIVVNEGLDFRFWSPEATEGLLMNPWPRQFLAEFFASDLYRGTVETKQAYREGVAVLALDRWGRVLLQLRDDDLPPERFPGVWSLPGGMLHGGEAPDAAGFREFEEETGHLLEDLKLFRVYRRDELPTQLVDVQHVYYGDPDIPEEHVDVREGQAFRYFSPGDIAAIEMPPHARLILDQFFESPAYKALFH